MSEESPRAGTGRSWLVFAIAVTFAALALARGHLPNPAAIHWNGDGDPNGASSPWTVAIVMSAIAAVISAALWRANPRAQRAAHGFLAAMLLATQTLTLWANWDRHRWQDAASVRLPALLFLVLVPVIVSYLAMNYGEQRTTSDGKRVRTGGLVGALVVLVGAILLIQIAVAVGGAAAAALAPLLIVALFFGAATQKPRVDVRVDERNLTVTMRGFDAMLCVRRTVVVPISAVRDISVVSREDIPRPGMRMPGTALPGAILAGSFGFGEERTFWDVRRGQTLLRIELDPQQAEYHRIVLELGDPAAVASRLTRARRDVASSPSG